MESKLKYILNLPQIASYSSKQIDYINNGPYKFIFSSKPIPNVNTCKIQAISKRKK